MQHGVIIPDNQFTGGPLVPVYIFRLRGQSNDLLNSFSTLLFIGHGVMFINDTFQNGGPAGTAQLWKSTSIGNHVSIGSNATILPVNICDHAVIGAGAVVTKDIDAPGVFAGNPAVKIKNL